LDICVQVVLAHPEMCVHSSIQLETWTNLNIHITSTLAAHSLQFLLTRMLADQRTTPLHRLRSPVTPADLPNWSLPEGQHPIANSLAFQYNYWPGPSAWSRLQLWPALKLPPIPGQFFVGVVGSPFWHTWSTHCMMPQRQQSGLFRYSVIKEFLCDSDCRFYTGWHCCQFLASLVPTFHTQLSGTHVSWGDVCSDQSIYAILARLVEIENVTVF